jgi:leucyl-tRNA synthetase
MFMGPIEADKIRNDNALHGIKKFLDRVEKIPTLERYGKIDNDVIATVHDTIIKVTKDVEEYKFNTAISKIMIAINTIYDHKAVDAKHLGLIAQLLTPLAPMIGQSLWEKTGHSDDIQYSARPVGDETKITLRPINFPIQVNGKMRGTLIVSAGISESELMEKVLADTTIAKYLTGTTKKIIFVADKIMNIINN